MPENLHQQNSSQLLPRRRELSWRRAGQETLVRDSASGKVHFFNATAALVWECCDGNTTAEDCERRMRVAFTIPDTIDVIADIHETVEDFARRGLLEGGILPCQA